jgi:hypothetical protein
MCLSALAIQSVYRREILFGELIKTDIVSIVFPELSRYVAVLVTLLPEMKKGE